MARQAAAIFPFNRYIRTLLGYVSIATSGPIKDIAEALRGDPLSADLTYGLARAYHFQGNAFMAEAMLGQFLRIAPNSKIAKGVTNGTMAP